MSEVKVPVKWFERLLHYADKLTDELKRKPDIAEKVIMNLSVFELIGYAQSAKTIIEKSTPAPKG